MLQEQQEEKGGGPGEEGGPGGPMDCKIITRCGRSCYQIQLYDLPVIISFTILSRPC